MLLRIDDRVRPFVQLAVFVFRNVRVLARHQGLYTEINRLVDDYRRRFATTSAAAEVLKSARQMYAAVGIDPTKTRPSSEALLRRIVQGKGLYRVNSVADCFNLLSLKFLVPVGLYDAATLRGDISFRLGSKGESYAGIGKDEIHLDGRYCLADALGPFGNPSSDSFRARITPETKTVLAVFFLPYQWPHTEDLMKICPETFLRYHPAIPAAATLISATADFDLADK